MRELWRDVVGYEGFYQVSNLGSVRSLDRVVNNRRVKGRVLKPFQDKDGYKKVNLVMGGKKRRQFMIHRLVSKMFIPNPENKPEVNHKDGNKQNNNIDNLEWVTKRENARHAWDNGLKEAIIGENCSWHKLTDKDVRDIRDMYETGEYTQVELGKRFDVAHQTISKIVNYKIRNSIGES